MGETARKPESEESYGRVADAVEGSWVDIRAPARLRPYLRLSRADRPIGAWLLLLPCWWALPLAIASNPASFRAEDLWIAVGCGLGAYLMRGAGCSWNDFTDRKLDAKVRRTRSRPLPSGQLTPRQALVWMAAQALPACAILLTFNSYAIVLGMASLAPVAIYPFAKRFTWWPQLFLGIAFNWGALLAWAAHTGSISAAPVLLYVAGVFWTLFYDTIYAHQDRDDDGPIGVRSTARLLGSRTKLWLAVFAVLSVVFMLAAAGIGLEFAQQPLGLAFAGAGAAGFGIHLAWQLWRLDINDSRVCLELFRANRNAGLIPALFFTAAAVAGSVTLSSASQSTGF